MSLGARRHIGVSDLSFQATLLEKVKKGLWKGIYFSQDYGGGGGQCFPHVEGL